MKIALLSLLSISSVSSFQAGYRLNTFVPSGVRVRQCSTFPKSLNAVADNVESSSPDPISPQQQSSVEKLRNVSVTSLRTNQPVNLFDFLTTPGTNDGWDIDTSKSSSSSSGSKEKVLLILATYAADFNAIEYIQRLRYYLPQLREKGIRKIGLVLNAEPSAVKSLLPMLDFPPNSDDDDLNIHVLTDPLGVAGKAFGVERGFKPDDYEMSPYLKLFGMLFGLGAWATLPAVIGGYIGNPLSSQPWIEDALAVGQMQKRWPDNALEIDSSTGRITTNKFTELPVVGNWERRPLELATLRLQNMVGISILNWSTLAPKDDALNAGVLTQLGGCVVVDPFTRQDVFKWRDPGICAVLKFEDLLEEI